uniref:ZFYVE26-like TPR repeats domain-containing protein n=1 Tax=Oryza meridionalis TaxID=40149 RepID=A0A0E0C460_9ORYZ
MAASEREAELLARVAANHLYLGQFEALRAALLSLRRRADPGLAAGFLRAVVAAGGRVPGVLWSAPPACPSPSHLAWLAALELAALPSTPNPEALRLKAEFLVLLQHVADDPAATGAEARGTLSRLLDLGVARLKREVEGGGEAGVGAEEVAVSQEDLTGLWGLFLGKAELFDALCAGVSRQVALDSGLGTDVLLWLRQSVQLAHLDAMKSLVAAGDLEGATGHLRFLCLDHGVEEDEYKIVLGDLVRRGWPKSSNYGGTWFESHDRIIKMLGSALQSSTPQLVQLIQLILDDILSEEIEDHGASDANWMPLPFKKFMETLSLERGAYLDDKTMLNRAITSCKKDLYHYSRISGKHVLEVVMETVLSLIKREQLQEAANAISMFPLLQPLVAVLGWDILKGKTALRRKLLQLFWTSKSQALRLQEYPHYRTETDETSCEEYLCDLLCFHLDVACFVSSVNSGRQWNLRNSLLFTQQEQDSDVNSTEILDPFVENLILERLAVQTPIRVLFDVVPGIKMHDIELMHMRYALQSAALSLGEMEKSAIDGNEHHYQIALSYLREMQSFMEAIKSTPRKIYMVSIVLSLLHMDDSIKLSEVAPSECSVSHECLDSNVESEEKNMVTSFVGLLLDILRHNLMLDMDNQSSMGLSPAGRQALEWRFKHAKHSIEDLDWRLSVLQRLPPLSERQWSWKEALVLLRAAPSKLLNVANYDIGEEAVQRFSLPAEDKASLELAEWVAGAYRIALVEDAVNRATDNSNATQLDILSFRAQLGPLTTILLCIDVAATSARSGDMCRFLLDEATSLLSEIFPGSSPKVGPNYWDQIQEVALISVIKRILQRLRDILDLRPLGLLHQMIDDAFKGKRQFLNGKLHNVARAIVDEDSDGTYSKESIKIEKKDILSSEKGIILGHGLRILKQASRTDQTASTVVENNAEHKGSTSRYLGPVSTKPSTYLSNFIIYIATIGDIVDGTDTTHDFNYFSLVYERPKDLLTRLVFERGSTDAAAKVADTMGVDFVHEIISACVPPVFPPRTGQGWACIPLLPTLSKINSENRSQSAQGWSVHDSSLSSRQEPLYPLQLNLVKHLAQLSSVRAVLACVFGSSILSGDSELYSNVKDAKQAPEIKRSFYEFALEQSERYPTLNRWIQMQCNLHRVSESAVSAETDNEVTLHQPKGKFSSKRAREPDSDAESEIEDIVISGKSASNSLESPKCDEAKLEPTTFISFDWDNEGPYEKAVERYLHNWDLDAAANVLTLCICHLPENDPMWSEVLRMKQSLQRYGHIMTADDHYTRWQEVEVDCEDDPEGLALRLAAKGAVSAALEVAESASLSIDLRRELQGRQLVKLLTTDPLNGGGPAAASRFLSTLRDSNDALPVAIGAMKLLPDLRSKQLLRTVGNLSDDDVARLNSWALGLRVLSLLPLPSQQRCSSLHEHPQLILEVLLMMKQLQSASLILKEFPSLRDDKLIVTYAKKAISINVNSTPREPRLTISGSRAKQKKVAAPAKTNFVQSFGNFQREARKAFSWVPRDSGTKTPPKDILRKRKSSGSGGERSSWEATPGVQEERAPEYPSEGQERLPFVSAPEEWVLTGDPDKDNATRACHRYESSPDITLFKALLSLCTSDSIAGKGALEICITQMRDVLSSLQLPLNASMDNIARAYHATETYVQALSYAKNLLKKLVGTSDLSSSSERSRDVDDISVDTGSSSAGSQNMDGLSDLLPLADLWLGRAELLQSLLGSGIIASLDDFADKESSTNLRDRLIDAFPVWVAWGHALVRMEHYSQARVKFKQALQQYKGDATHFVLEIISTIEGGPPVDVSSVRSMYEHLAKSAATIFDDSLSADAYLNVLYMPSTFPRSERSRQSKGPMDSQFESVGSYLEDGPRSNLDGIRYAECIHYLQEYARPEMLAFMFRHGHYAEACSLFFPSNQPTDEGETSLSSIPRNDPLTTDYGTIDDLCDLCLGYGAMTVLENTILTITQSPTYQGSAMTQYMNAILTRICNYCETHRHFNYLYNFLVLKGDHVASGLCCIQLYVNSMSQEEALKHLGHAKSHFEEALSVRDRTTEATKLVPRTARNKSASEKMTRETIMKFSTRVSYQMDVVKALNSVDGPQWKTSLFGNPTDAETLRRRCMVVETLAEKHFDLAFRMLHEFDLPAVDIYAGVAASLAERKKGGQLTEFLKNIRGTIDDDEWDQVLGAAINVYANKHKERPDRLIDMLLSNHRKVLACVVCGRLKSAFQIASRSGSVADVQYVAHQALHANALPVLDMCKQWLAQYM